MITILPSDDILAPGVFEAIGRIALYFNVLEESLENTICILCRSVQCENEAELYILCRRMGLQEKIGCIRDLVGHSVAGMTEKRRATEAMRRLNSELENVSTLAGRRNVLMHGLAELNSDTFPEPCKLTMHQKRGNGKPLDLDVPTLEKLAVDIESLLNSLHDALITFAEIAFGWGSHQCVVPKGEESPFSPDDK
jgi:hypothetical protein